MSAVRTIVVNDSRSPEATGNGRRCLVVKEYHDNTAVVSVCKGKRILVEVHLDKAERNALANHLRIR
jgi:hypothetical protein